MPMGTRGFSHALISLTTLTKRLHACYVTNVCCEETSGTQGIVLHVFVYRVLLLLFRLSEPLPDAITH